jgi:hypothetical protein
MVRVMDGTIGQGKAGECRFEKVESRPQKCRFQISGWKLFVGESEICNLKLVLF